MWQQAEPCIIIIMIIVWQNYFCACQGSGSHCGCGFDFGTASASGSGSGNGSRSDGTFHNLLHFRVVRWQTAQKSAAKIQMNSKLLKRQPDRRRGRTARLWHCRHDAAGSETAAETAVSVTTTFDLKRAVRTRSEKLLLHFMRIQRVLCVARQQFAGQCEKGSCRWRRFCVRGGHHTHLHDSHMQLHVCACVFVCGGVWCTFPSLLG